MQQKYSVWYCNNRYMTLYICSKSKIYNTKSKPSCKLRSLESYDVSMQVTICNKCFTLMGNVDNGESLCTCRGRVYRNLYNLLSILLWTSNCSLKKSTLLRSVRKCWSQGQSLSPKFKRPTSEYRESTTYQARNLQTKPPWGPMQGQQNLNYNWWTARCCCCCCCC